MTDCWAVGVDESSGKGIIIATNDGGTSWVPEVVQHDRGFRSVSCPAEGECWAGAYLAAIFGRDPDGPSVGTPAVNPDPIYATADPARQANTGTPESMGSPPDGSAPGSDTAPPAAQDGIDCGSDGTFLEGQPTYRAGGPAAGTATPVQAVAVFLSLPGLPPMDLTEFHQLPPGVTGPNRAVFVANQAQTEKAEIQVEQTSDGWEVTDFAACTS